MPRFQASTSFNARVSQPIIFCVVVIDVFVGQKRLNNIHWYESQQTGWPTDLFWLCTCPQL